VIITLVDTDGKNYHHSVVYLVPDEVADNLRKHCIFFADKWMKRSPNDKKFKINGYHIGRKQGKIILIPLNLYRPSAYKVNQEDNQIALKLDVINDKIDMINNRVNDMNKNIKVLISLFSQPYQSNQ
jgi:hypothetical protein